MRPCWSAEVLARAVLARGRAGVPVLALAVLTPGALALALALARNVCTVLASTTKRSARRRGHDLD